jgi:hypothetical protein
MGSAAGGDGRALDATVAAVDGPAEGAGEHGPHNPQLHEQLKAIAEHAELSVELAERQIADLQEAMEARRQHAREAADELRAYEDRYDINQTNRRTTPQE